DVLATYGLTHGLGLLEVEHRTVPPVVRLTRVVPLEHPLHVIQEEASLVHRFTLIRPPLVPPHVLQDHSSTSRSGNDCTPSNRWSVVASQIRHHIFLTLRNITHLLRHPRR